MTSPNPIRVLIVDDSPLVRRTLEELLTGYPGVRVVGMAVDGLDALAKIRALRPDLVTLDVMMPNLDGLKVLACIMRENPVRVLMISSLTQEGAEETLLALDLGAVDFIDKTELLFSPDPASSGRELMRKIRIAAAVNPARLGQRPPAAVARGAVARPPGAPAVPGADVVVIGASTGGPPALQSLIPALPGDLAAGVVVIQHIPEAFIGPLAQRLDAASALSVSEAAAGDRIRSGQVLIAPAGRHLIFADHVGERVVILRDEPSNTMHRPSVDVTMESASRVFGPRSLGVLLTGMGTDGARGMSAIKACGGWTIAESEESCVVYGMPRAAVESGAASEVVSLRDLPTRIVAAVTGCRPEA